MKRVKECLPSAIFGSFRPYLNVQLFKRLESCLARQGTIVS